MRGLSLVIQLQLNMSSNRIKESVRDLLYSSKYSNSPQATSLPRRNRHEPSFIPKYKQTSAFDRQQLEFYGSLYPREPPRATASTSLDLSAKDRKHRNMSSTLDDLTVQDSYQKHTEKEREFPTETRRKELRETHHRRKNPVDDNEHDEDRRKNHLYSDLFGTSARAQATQNPCRPAQTDSEAAGQRQLASSLDRRAVTPDPSKSNPFTVLQPTPFLYKAREFSTSYSTYQPPPSEQPTLITLELARIPMNFNEFSIKTLCHNLHIVSISVDINNITGACKGTGSLTLRAFDLKSDVACLTLALANAGIRVTKKEENHGLKDSYSGLNTVNWMDPKLERAQRVERPTHECKISGLESSEDVFGGVGRWGSQWRQQKLPTAVDKQFESEMQWLQTLKAKRII